MKKVVVLGGHNRIRIPLERYAREKNIDLEFIEKPQQNLKEVLKKADFVIVLIKLVSHEMVKIAKNCSQEKCIFCPQQGVCALKRIINLINN